MANELEKEFLDIKSKEICIKYDLNKNPDNILLKNKLKDFQNRKNLDKEKIKSNITILKSEISDVESDIIEYNIIKKEIREERKQLKCLKKALEFKENLIK